MGLANPRADRPASHGRSGRGLRRQVRHGGRHAHGRYETMADIAAVEGIAETYKAKLQGLGVGTVEALLERGASPKGRAEMAAATGISDKLILKWVNHADLF